MNMANFATNANTNSLEEAPGKMESCEIPNEVTLLKINERDAVACFPEVYLVVLAVAIESTIPCLEPLELTVPKIKSDVMLKLTSTL